MNMKRTITHIFAAAALILASVSCWNEEMDDLAMGKDLKLRHQVSDLKAVPGDTEVQLSWTMEEGWNPTQYVITYTNPDQSAGKIETRDQSCLVTGLQNGYNYTFNVQAQYDDVFSGVQAVSAKPVTSRIAVKDLAAVAMDEAVVLSWTMPSTNVQGYKLLYYMEDTPSDVKTVTVGKSTSPSASPSIPRPTRPPRTYSGSSRAESGKKETRFPTDSAAKASSRSSSMQPSEALKRPGR